MTPIPIDPAFLPVSGLDLPRFAGIATFMRLPHVAPGSPAYGQVEVGLLGVPWDGGTTNRPGARHGPRALRDASTMMRYVNGATGVVPFHLARHADLGDVAPNPAGLEDTLGRVEAFLAGVAGAGIAPVTVGGDHLTSLPVLRGLAKARGGGLGMIHFDAHTDLWDSYFGGTRMTHGTPFRRAIEEGLLDPRRVVQIGIRGTTYDDSDTDFAAANGVRVVRIEELMDRGTAAVMAEARAIVGDGPAYVSFDIDGIDPSQAPGTGTPEVGGFSTFEAQRMVRALGGIDLVGCDLVEVSPPFDVGGLTALVGATMLFELLCVIAPAEARRRGRAAG